MVNLFNMFEDMMGSFIPIIILLFIVAWSDHFGRRFLIMMSLGGKILDMIVYVITTLIPSCPAPVLIVGQLLRSIGGDNIIFSNAVYSYIADRTNGEDRTYRMTIVSAIWFLGQPAGVFLGPHIF